jgi:hypothetical protein
VTPLRGDRWEGATFEVSFNTIGPDFARNSAGVSFNS